MRPSQVGIGPELTPTVMVGENPPKSNCYGWRNKTKKATVMVMLCYGKAQSKLVLLYKLPISYHFMKLGFL